MTAEAHSRPQRTYQVKLGETFEGPLDLLLYLVKKNEVDIYDIPISTITEQYMEYIDLMKVMNIDVAGNFLVMAATLAQIKSRMLLPVDEEEEEEEDPRMEIVRPLEEYLQIKYAAEDLAVRNWLDRDVFTRNVMESESPAEGEGQETFIKVSLFELIDAFQQIVKRVASKELFDITVDTISVKARISELVDLLETRQSMTFVEFFEGQAAKSQVIVTFLALLEMAKLQIIRIMQHVESGVIRVFLS
jgi:segregation and condensation protein A